MDIVSESGIMIQRYTRGNWPAIRGLEPFIVTGPNFKKWVIPGSLINHREYRFAPELLQILATADGEEQDVARESIAEFLLREGICKALWSVNVATVLPQTERWEASVMTMTEEIPRNTPVSEWTIELLSGLSDDSYYRSYLAETGVVLEALIPPVEDV